ncbi:MAG: hypothetical protein ACI93P_001272 [bacterium]|jgi:hypothetical protein
MVILQIKKNKLRSNYGLSQKRKMKFIGVFLKT